MYIIATSKDIPESATVINQKYPRGVFYSFSRKKIVGEIVVDGYIIIKEKAAEMR
jgi:hypothetical protein